jgi:adenylate cyclase
MEWTGGCMCGAIRYEASGPPNESGTCHCHKCQQFSGSAYFAFAAFAASAFRFTRGEPKLYRSTSIGERGFCPNCGSSLTFRYLESWGGDTKADPSQYWVGVGTLDHPEAVTLDFHYGVEGQLPWVHFDDDLPRTRCEDDSELAATYAAAESKAE